MSEQLEQSSDNSESTSISMELLSARLKEVREAKGLTIESVAADLRLNANLIKALELNDIANLPSKTFVMGYLRGYARLLGVDGSELEQLDLSEINQTVDMKSTLSGPSEKNSKHFSVRFVTYLVTAVMLSLLVAWWLSMQSDISEIIAVEEYQQYEQPAENRLSLPTESSDQAVASASVEVTPEQQQVEVDKSDSEGVEQATVANEVAADVVSEIRAETEVVEEAAAPIAQSELTITYLQDSWTEISDATDSRLLYGLYKQGREVVIEGVAPFSLFLGYAPGVVVTHNEEQIEHTAFHQNGVARFKVGKAEDNHLPITN